MSGLFSAIENLSYGWSFRLPVINYVLAKKMDRRTTRCTRGQAHCYVNQLKRRPTVCFDHFTSSDFAEVVYQINVAFAAITAYVCNLIRALLKFDSCSFVHKTVVRSLTTRWGFAIKCCMQRFRLRNIGIAVQYVAQYTSTTWTTSTLETPAVWAPIYVVSWPQMY